jgi:hypothetical protein
LHIVDSDERCIEACRRRFRKDERLSSHVNNGRSLEMISDHSIDFVFSFDSLVHVPRETVQAYVRQLADKLTDEGVGFIHHSNLGAYASPTVERLPRRMRKLLTRVKILDRDHRRAPDMTAELFRSSCAAHGLICIRQELINWRSRRLIDCFSTFARSGSKWADDGKVLRNANFMREAKLIRQWSSRSHIPGR